jgi:hypothetical protein
MNTRTPCSSHRAFTIADVAVGVASLTMLVAVVGATAASLRTRGNEAVSMSNLMQLGVSQAMYSWDHEGLQWCAHQSDFGLVGGNCATYISTIGCPPQMVLGTDVFGGLWGYWLGGGVCPPTYPGNCGNWVLYTPNEWSFANGVAGSWKLLQSKSFHEYANGRFYDPGFYAPNDRPTYRRAAPNFDYPAAFTPVPSSPVTSSYTMSPAAMWHPDVMRGASQGGFRNPSSFPEAFERQPLFGAAHPDLKSLVFEQHWNQGGQQPASGQGLAATSTFRYNQSAAATPITLFYDGHVWFLPNSVAIADDKALRARKLDGLWSRDTPLGADGYYGATSIDGSTTSHSVLTTDGILGRDVLKPQ